ncbi:MAG: proton-conducting transporter membrane subunit [Streptosporangiaceae bacterium]
MSGYSVVLAAGLVLLALAAAIDLVAGASRPRLMPLPYLFGAAASASLVVAGSAALAGRPVRLGLSGVLGPGTAGPAADRLSGLFLALAFGAAFAVSLAFASWAADGARPGRRGLGASYSLALGALAIVLTARDAFTLLFAWESLTLAFYLLAGFERSRPGRPAAAMVTLAFGRVSGVCLLAGLLLLAAHSNSLALASLGHVRPGALRSTAEVLLLLGFAVKVGLVPFQVWLPRGYAAAAGPARPIMAGVAVNAGFYGLWRTLALLGPPPAGATRVLLVLASLTAVLGIAHAAVQTGLQRVIAYSSVENTGLILAGFGVALVGAAVRSHELLAAGLLAATFQVVTHTVAKSLLFTASARIEEAAGTDDLDRLGAAARLVPWSGTGLAIGSLTLAGLPPTAGFVSEWFLLEALMQQFRVPGLGDRLALAVAGAAVALTAGFAGVTFVRLIGLTVLGRPGCRSAQPRDYGLTGRAGVVLLSAACLVIAALTPLEIRVIAVGLSPIVPAAATMGALKSPWVLQPVFAGFSILSPSWLWVVMPALFLIVAAGAWALSGRRLLRVRRVPRWRSATAGVSGRDSYTAFGFANPTRRVLAAVLHTRSGVSRLGVQHQAGAAEPGSPAGPGPAAGPAGEAAPVTPAVQASRATQAAGAAPAARAAQAAHIGYRSDVIEVVEEYVYRPVRRPFLLLVRAAQRLQSGRLDAYLAYMLIALVAVLAVVTGLH